MSDKKNNPAKEVFDFVVCAMCGSAISAPTDSTSDDRTRKEYICHFCGHVQSLRRKPSDSQGSE
jgi:alpha-D-ribose 1-methylphosphonate 5-phosphate C-P lyase